MGPVLLLIAGVIYFAPALLLLKLGWAGPFRGDAYEDSFGMVVKTLFLATPYLIFAVGWTILVLIYFSSRELLKGNLFQQGRD